MWWQAWTTPEMIRQHLWALAWQHHLDALAAKTVPDIFGCTPMNSPTNRPNELSAVIATEQVTSHRITFKSTVRKLEQKQRLVRAWKEGDDVKTEIQPVGWFMLLEGSHEYLYVGEEKPIGFEIGKRVTVEITTP